MGKVVTEVLNDLSPNPSVVELGNQRFTVTDDTLKDIIASVRYRSQTDLPALEKILKTPKKEREPLTESFYHALGFKKFVAIDVNHKFGSIAMDLNFDIRTHYNYREVFDLVTNNGTGEHILNQQAIFKNCHDLCAVNGLMVHIMPFVNWVNHGFFNFHPVLYADLAAANQYDMIKLSLANRWGSQVSVDILNSDNHSIRKMNPYLKRIPGYSYYHSRTLLKRLGRLPLEEFLTDIKLPVRGHLLAAAVDQLTESDPSTKTHSNIMIVAVLRKTKAQEFVVPMQGKYVRDIEEKAIQTTYQSQKATPVGVQTEHIH